MSEIDERIVKMTFDNQQFEQASKTTLGTLDKLKQSLRFDKVKDAFSNLNKSATKVDLAPVQNGVDTITTKFKALDVAAFTALQRITNKAIDAGEKLVSSFTIDPIKSGLKEYETQIGSVQTIMSNTQDAFENVSRAEHLKAVNDTLDELNTYADKTIYNFTEMTRNIGTFTAAGVDLKTSAGAIQGIANMAAMSGSTSQQASTAMYQLSQALAAGAVKLQDWNSVVNAGMGGKLFQNKLREVSEELGTGAEKYIKAAGSFRESLSKGWITSEVLATTLNRATMKGAIERSVRSMKQYAKASDEVIEKRVKAEEAALNAAIANGEEEKGYKDLIARLKEGNSLKDETIEKDISFARNAQEAATKVRTLTALMDTLSEAMQSGWTQTWEILIGDFDQATELFTAISNKLGAIIQVYSDVRNGALQAWADFGGRKHLLGAFASLGNSLKRFVRPIQKAYSVIFPSQKDKNGLRIYTDIGMALKTATRNFRLFTRTLKTSKEHQQNIQKTFEVLFAVIKAVSSVIGKFAKAGFVVFIRAFQAASTVIFAVTSKLWYMRDAITGMIKLLGKPAEIITNIVNSLADKSTVLGAVFFGLLNVAKVFFSTLWDGIKKMGDHFNTLFAGNEKIQKLKESFSELKEVVSKAFGKNTNLKTVRAMHNKMGKLATSAKNAAESLTTFVEPIITLSAPAIVTGISKLSDGLSGLLDTTTGFAKGKISKFEDYVNNLRSFKDIVKGVRDDGAMTRSLGSMEYRTEDSLTLMERLQKALLNIQSLFNRAFSVIKKYAPIIGKKIRETFTNGFQSISETFHNINGEDLSSILSSSIFSGGVVAIIRALKDFRKQTTGIREAIADTLGGVTNVLETMQTNVKADIIGKLAKSIAILTGSLVILAMIDQGALDKSIRALTGIAAIVLMIAKAQSLFSSAPKAVETVASPSAQAMPALLGVFTNIGNACSDFIRSYQANSTIQTAKAIVYMAGAVLIISKAVVPLSKLSFDELKLGIGGVVVIMGALAALAWWMKKNGSAVNMSFGLGMLGLAEGISIIADAVKLLAGIKDVNTLIIASVIVGALILSIGTAVALMGDPKHMISIGVGLIAMSIAVYAMIGAIVLFAKIIEKARADESGESIYNLVIGIVVVIGLIAVLAAAVKTMDAKGTIGVAATLIALSMAIYAIIGAIVIVSLIIKKVVETNNWAYFLSGFLAVIVLIFAIAGAIRLMGEGMKSIAVAGAILALATALIILSGAVAMLSGTSLGDVGKALLLLAGAFIILGVAAIALQGWLGAVDSIATSLLKVGIAVLAITAALVLLSPALVALSGTLAITGAAIVGAIFAILTAVVVGIGGLAVEVIGLIVVVGKALCQAIIALAPSLCDALAALIQAVVYAIGISAYAIAEAVVLMILAVIDVLAKYMNPIIDRVVVLIINFFLALADNIRHHTEGIGKAIMSVIEAITEIVLTLIESLFGALPVIGDKVIGWVEDVKKGLRSELEDDFGITENGVSNMEQTFTEYNSLITDNADNMHAAGAANGAALFTGLTEGLQNEATANPLTDVIDGVLKPDAIAESFDFSQFTELGGNIDEGLGQGVFDNKEMVTKPMGDMISEGFGIMETISDTHSPSIRGEDLGMNIDLGIAQGLEKGAPDVKRAFRGTVIDLFELTKVDKKKIAKYGDQIITALSDAISSNTKPGQEIRTVISKLEVELIKLENKFQRHGMYAMRRFAMGIHSYAPLAYAEMRKVKQNLISVMDGLYDDFEAAGSNTVLGLTDGIKKNSETVIKAGSTMAEQIREGYINEMIIASPAKAMRPLADYTVDGLVKQIEKRSKDAKEAGTNLGSSLEGGLFTALMLMAAAVDGIAECDPVIRPVIDLSGIQNGAEMIEGMMAQRSYMLSMQLGDYSSGQINRLNAISASIDGQTFDNSDVVRAVNSMGSRIDNLESAILNMQVVLDSGAIVGVVDKGIGARVARRMRGN